MITETDILDALTKAAAYDASRTPKTSRMLLKAWTEHFNAFPAIDRADLLAAVTAYHREPRDRMLAPADLSTIARADRRDQLDRSDVTDPARIAVEARADAKATDAPRPPPDAADEHSERLQRVIAGFNPTDTDDAAALAHLTPLTDSPLRADCPWCGALTGSPCRIPNAYDRTGRAIVLTRSPAHPARFAAANLPTRYADTTEIRQTPPRPEPAAVDEPAAAAADEHLNRALSATQNDQTPTRAGH
jgi:hypothetical protein